ncbi:hypothetical protein DC28_04035 [Spirochaeta lutea]|uniref:Endonuclease/exonuclease/phosphatase domain-containing protein n=2 Tax=Spirochaeta lutea TaxID=1480694 RepID=A0A098R185_9SPIO|nr:hypothetical protein DC28_04035 [Spirochaeta lutea]
MQGEIGNGFRGTGSGRAGSASVPGGFLSRGFRVLCLAAGMALGSVLSSCVPPGVAGQAGDHMVLVSYNTQTFFDDEFHGHEFDDFYASAHWDSKAYLTRLSRLARVIREAGQAGHGEEGRPGDVVVLNEIEGPDVLEDLHELYLHDLGYTGYLTTQDPWSALQTAVVTRLPVSYHRSLGVTQDGTRYRSILEVGLRFRDEPMVLFACHWKSKSGGARQTEPGRLAAARALAGRMAEVWAEDPGVAMVVAGDLNEVYNEGLTADYPTALGLVYPGGSPGLRLLAEHPSPEAWLEAGHLGLYSFWAGVPGGSYFYQGTWEGIDHILVNRAAWEAPGLRVEEYGVFAPEFLLTREGRPKGFIQRLGTGFSDHLPVFMRFSRD